MPRATTSKARKDYPESGIKKGDIYYSWSFYRGPVQRSLTPPKQSQLCNPKLSSAFEAVESLEEAIAGATSPEDLTAALQKAIEGVQASLEEYEETVSNLKDAWPNGCPALEEATENQDNLQSCIDGLESAISDIETMDVDDFVTEDQYTLDKKPEDFSGLNEDDQNSFMESAREIAGGVSLDV